MKRHSHLISVAFMVVACLIAAREYYINYQIDVSLGQADNVPAEEQNLNHSNQTSPMLIGCSNSNEELEEQYQTVEIRKGDTLGSLLAKFDISKQDIESLNKSLKGHLNPRDLKPGQAFSIQYKKDQQGVQLLGAEFKPSLEYTVVCERNEKGQFKTQKNTVELKTVLKRVDGRINASFYSAALKLGIPAKVVKEAIKALSYSVNFQHGIKSGDPFELLYEQYEDAQGNSIKPGNLKYISVVAKGQLHRIYSYAPAGNCAGYYNARGESVIRSLLQTPIDSSRMRVTSGFGSRVHPIKGFRRDHKGVDFGAPHGTAVMAAGDGVVLKAGYFGDYGNYVRIRHAGGYETVYAHLSKIASGTRIGASVKQGQVIGNVGATGLATGPHLHHEVILKNVHVNPQSVKALPTTHLATKDIQKFNKFKQEIETQIVGLPMKNQLASNDLNDAVKNKIA
ncbi:peptidoglycan DD-metalloendopeptidase family protein [Candidatus Finniella inopinata]|uniref:LysM peptidoglycan-binding domain-containing protein n=1 Tax=Candidatus Finniella inopinata TaxID=1696036 RepID=A0A4Q7DJT1_9PROT|nr:peptidoglycan DD-metalloendopeptidase family protein [Candidatus Finniella inopinata]RZI47133.1 LysM peptidoglycan-binding domain-containing protein [Candidatus Finniella inopinata]